MDSTSYIAVVLAADRSSGDPLAEAAGVPSKCLVPAGGKPMVLRVLDALEEAREVKAVILCGPQRSVVEGTPALAARIGSGKVTWVMNRESPSSSTSHVLLTIPDTNPVVVTTGDHALLTALMVDHFCSEARSTGADIVVGLAPHLLVRAAFPETRRTVIRMRGGAYCTCNLFAFLTPRSRTVADFWQRVEQERKRTLRVIGAFGWWSVILYLLRLLSLKQGLERISRRLGLRAAAVLMPFAEAAVDVDTIHDWKLVEERLAR
ncbi:MAG TPA: nucleotidyltransferase family protein [Syntrophobacteria bacterium]|nr:nucleotidyltransferase family protein [Syntrophobacteria bacterium]